MTEYYWITKDGFKTTKQTEKTMTDHKLEAIEMYTKILEVVKGQDFHDTTTALRFAQTKIETDFEEELARIFSTTTSAEG